MPRSSASIPIAVHEGQPSTIIAHALASNEYQRSLEEIVKNPPADIISSAGLVHIQMSLVRAYSSQVVTQIARALQVVFNDSFIAFHL